MRASVGVGATVSNGKRDFERFPSKSGDPPGLLTIHQLLNRTRSLLNKQDTLICDLYAIRKSFGRGIVSKFFSVQSQCSLCLRGGQPAKTTHHRDTENAEDAQRR